MPKSSFDSLVRDGVLTREALAAAVKAAADKGMTPGWILVHENKIPIETVGKALSAHYRVPFVAYRDDLKPLQEVVDRLKVETCLFYRIAPIAREKGRLVLVMADPGNLPMKDQLEGHLGEPFHIRVGLEEDIHRMLTGVERQPRVPMLEPDLESLPVEEEISPTEFVVEEESPMVAMANTLLVKYLIQAKGEELRIDPRQSPRTGVLLGGAWQDLMLPDPFHQNLVRRYKVMANLDIGNRAKPQEGSFELQLVGGRRKFKVAIDPLGGGDEAVRITPA